MNSSKLESQILLLREYLSVLEKAKKTSLEEFKSVPKEHGKCGHTEKANRNKKNNNCGYQSIDDRIGAMNLYRTGINYLVDSQSHNRVNSFVKGVVTFLAQESISVPVIHLAT